ncbi:MAG: M23 family metallopeptidase, partial [Verrucomicrobia bacterium]|nr:M23 family metallopeptidase [Verrucomicrobiota bacterium]
PINGARVGSGFGNRRHPISGYTKKHEGVDFSAPTGTLVFAAGAGEILKACRSGGLGNIVKIRHNNEYSTVYGHLSKFAKGIRPGVKVSQGAPIGYVGQTGHATGPHLHFEVHKNGTKINPMLAANLSSGKLEGKALKKFLAAKKSIDHQMAKLSESARFALNTRDEDQS